MIQLVRDGMKNIENHSKDKYNQSKEVYPLEIWYLYDATRIGEHKRSTKEFQESEWKRRADIHDTLLFTSHQNLFSCKLPTMMSKLGISRKKISH